MNTHTFISRRELIAFAATSLLLQREASAQYGTYVRGIVNSTPGSGADALARAIQPGFSSALGTPLTIENQAGASGIIGLQMLARAPADGSVVGFASNNMVIFPSVMKNLPFNVASDFSPIGIIGEIPLVLVANPSKVSSTNAKEFAAILKSTPNAFNYASSGNGTILHLATELVLEEMGVKINHIPYKAATPMLTDTLGGQVDFCTAALPAALPYIKSGALRAIGVCMAKRVALAPEIPTFAEQGLPNAVVQSWHSMLGPKGMSPALTKRFHDYLATALQDATVKDTLAKQSVVVRLQTPEESINTIRTDLARYSKLVTRIGLQPV